MAKEIKNKELLTVALVGPKTKKEVRFKYKHTVSGLSVMEHGCTAAEIATEIWLRINAEVATQVKEFGYTISDIEELVEGVVYRNLHSLTTKSMDRVCEDIFEDLDFEISSEEAIWVIAEFKATEVICGDDLEELYKELEEQTV